MLSYSALSILLLVRFLNRQSGENCSKTFTLIKNGIVTVCRYFHMLPFLLLRTRLSPVVAVLVLLAIEVRFLK